MPCGPAVGVNVVDRSNDVKGDHAKFAAVVVARASARAVTADRGSFRYIGGGAVEHGCGSGAAIRST